MHNSLERLKYFAANISSIKMYYIHYYYWKLRIITFILIKQFNQLVHNQSGQRILNPRINYRALQSSISVWLSSPRLVQQSAAHHNGYDDGNLSNWSSGTSSENIYRTQIFARLVFGSIVTAINHLWRELEI